MREGARAPAWSPQFFNRYQRGMIRADPSALQPCTCRPRPYFDDMKLSLIQDYAIQARLAFVIGATVFDRIFAGVKFAETDGPLLYVYAKDEQTAAEIEDDFSLLIADVASRILKREVELVVVLPKVLQ
jgi:hypothetical protein